MNNYEFNVILKGAISGDKHDIEKLLKTYSPLINGASFIQGRLDEDLRQNILMHIIKNLSKFKI